MSHSRKTKLNRVGRRRSPTI